MIWPTISQWRNHDQTFILQFFSHYSFLSWNHIHSISPVEFHLCIRHFNAWKPLFPIHPMSLQQNVYITFLQSYDHKVQTIKFSPTLRFHKSLYCYSFLYLIDQMTPTNFITLLIKNHKVLSKMIILMGQKEFQSLWKEVCRHWFELFFYSTRWIFFLIPQGNAPH